MPRSSLRSWDQRCQEEDCLSSLHSSDRRRGWPFLDGGGGGDLSSSAADESVKISGKRTCLYTTLLSCDWLKNRIRDSDFLTNQRPWSCFLANRMTEGLYISRSTSQKFQWCIGSWRRRNSSPPTRQEEPTLGNTKSRLAASNTSLLWSSRLQAMLPVTTRPESSPTPSACHHLCGAIGACFP